MGPMAGLTIITNLANELQILTPQTDTCYRFGLNKIILLLPNTNTEQAHALCEELSEQMKGRDIFGLTPPPGFCFFISACYTEGRKDLSYEEMLLQTHSMQNMFYEFKVC
jgi:phospholipid/cholesterol/gamma-HCH transport system ATP-binding protein